MSDGGWESKIRVESTSSTQMKIFCCSPLKRTSPGPGPPCPPSPPPPRPLSHRVSVGCTRLLFGLIKPLAGLKTGMSKIPYLVLFGTDRLSQQLRHPVLGVHLTRRPVHTRHRGLIVRPCPTDLPQHHNKQQGNAAKGKCLDMCTTPADPPTYLYARERQREI